MARSPLVNPPPTSPATTKSMKGNAPKNTRPEIRLRRLLREAGYSGYRLHWKVAGRPDIAYPSRKVAIFVNGCYWHRCPKCNPPVPRSNTEFWTEKFRRNTERDERKRNELTELGWTVVTVWECELRDDPSRVLLEVVRVLAQSSRE
jgi:DNA mismatch endonuclease (patch repair protein)